ncbi:MAG: glutamate formimidoyltransferase [Thermodesulfobacteriota bacterium]|jgi:glutamate formiminotransferase
MKILECVPNFSEGKDEKKVEGIVAEVRKISGVKLLDYFSDPDHNRTMVTFIGEPGAVKQAALQSSLKALEIIDMRTHRGEHPRIGAVDVVPFVPIGGLAMEEAVRTAHQFGREFGERGEVPVYFYGEAATDPRRRKLADVRKGEFEGLKEKLSMPGWEPDAGVRIFNPRAGATVVGARRPLIAFNVNLGTQNLDLAKQVAKKIRESSGGIPSVQALGLELKEKGMVQVSMNLVDYHRASIPKVVEFIRAEIAGTGVEIVETELVGLLPREALEEVVRAYLKMPEFNSDQVIETHLLSA